MIVPIRSPTMTGMYERRQDRPDVEALQDRVGEDEQEADDDRDRAGDGATDGAITERAVDPAGEIQRREAGDEADEAVGEAPVPGCQGAPARDLVADGVADEAGEEPDDRAERVAEERHECEGRPDRDGAARDRDLGDEEYPVERRADGGIDDGPRGHFPQAIRLG